MSALSADVLREVSMAVDAASVAPTKADRKRVRARLHQKLVSMVNESRVTEAMKQFQDMCKEHRDLASSEAASGSSLKSALSFVPAFSMYQAPLVMLQQEQSSRSSLLPPTFAATGINGPNVTCSNEVTSATSATDEEAASYQYREIANAESSYAAPWQASPQPYFASFFSFVPAVSMYQVPVIVVPQQRQNQMRSSSQAVSAMASSGKGIPQMNTESSTHDEVASNTNLQTSLQVAPLLPMVYREGRGTDTPDLKKSGGNTSTTSTSAADDQESIDLENVIDTLDLSVSSPPVERTFIHFHLATAGCRRRSLSS